jgi:hypothetical protein
MFDYGKVSSKYSTRTFVQSIAQSVREMRNRPASREIASMLVKCGIRSASNNACCFHSHVER